MVLYICTRRRITAHADSIPIRVAYFELNQTVKHSLRSAENRRLTLNRGSDIENRRAGNP